MSDIIEETAPEQAEQFEDRKLYILEINKLTQDPNQPRKYFDDAEIAELGNSIKKHGVLQPILFRQGEDGQLIIVSGERRFRASTLVKMTTIPAIYTAGNTAEIALIENLLRVDLTPLEEAEGLKKLQEEAKYKNKELAAVIGKAESSISEILSLNKLPEKIKAEVRTSKIFSRRQLIEIAKIKDEKEQKKRFNAVKKMNTSDGSQKDRKDDKRGEAITTVRRMIQGLDSNLNKLDLNSLNEEELADVRSKLQRLVEAITQKLC
jgi:ParB family transcriptional regulator, chromosome partitioning protein